MAVDDLGIIGLIACIQYYILLSCKNINFEHIMTYMVERGGDIIRERITIGDNMVSNTKDVHQ